MATNNNYHGENNPTPTWQSVFINTIIGAIEQYREQNYFGSWDSMKELLAWMPDVCYKECKPIFDDMEKRFKKECTVQRNTYINAYRDSKKIATYFLRKELLELFRECRSSLETNGWISKEQNFGRPAYQTRAHLGNE